MTQQDIAGSSGGSVDWSYAKDELWWLQLSRSVLVTPTCEGKEK